MTQQAASIDAAQICIAKGNPTAEELAALTALISAMGNARSDEKATVAAPKRMARARRRRALTTPRLSWNLGRR
ncbi:acyl-CoA carboxylase subunit epsilon [Glutamicibacter sp.]|uniref:acyl-CoA carboxylase subunit epsilon n=1 Tax=Glutamicibacter sp. TaxID=1931995 RepID=UPI0028BE61BE|nr:acyl-CoA carboxylase subunit epsilon [Glutamicibacter sp.]